MFDRARVYQDFPVSSGPFGAGPAANVNEIVAPPKSDTSRLSRESAREPQGAFQESSAIVLGMLLSVSALGAFMVYHFHVRGVSGVGIYVHYGLLLSLFWCTFAYQLNRFGAARRRASSKLFADDELSYLYADDAPTVSILIPSYHEERRVLISTILSAALAQYSNRNIVVLVDDSPKDPTGQHATLEAIAEVRGWIEEENLLLHSEAALWHERKSTADLARRLETRRLAAIYRQVSCWLEGIAARLESERTQEFGHVDSFVIDRIVLDLADFYARRANEVRRAKMGFAEIDAEYRRVATLFCDDITSFQRKTFENLSHAPNKAMNLNAYIGLMGGRYAIVDRNGKRVIERTRQKRCDIAVNRPDYVLTLDADSVILSPYILTLVHTLEGNSGYGVAQTPYRTFPNGSSEIERTAGATTDIQYLVHQGSTYFDAAYWVGANALIRFSALKDIETEQFEGDKAVKVYVQDRTVIEDTGSTIDLLQRRWRVHNYFMTLAYSATPADFGALAIQRKRWANGGLILFPSLIREYLGAGRRVRRIPELTLRAHYLLSPVVGNVAVLALMIWSSADARSMMWTPLFMLPYFLLYALDLRRLGYRRRDLLGVCALNLMLLPVNFAGIFSSLRQLVTGRKGTFSRTPKVANRTYIPPYAFLFNIGVTVLMVHYGAGAVQSGQYAGAIVPVINIVLYAYGLLRFVGVKHGLQDVFLAVAVRFAFLPKLVQSMRRRLADSFLYAGTRLVPALALAGILLVVTPWSYGAGVAQGELMLQPVGMADSVIRYSDKIEARFMDERMTPPVSWGKDHLVPGANLSD